MLVLADHLALPSSYVVLCGDHRSLFGLRVTAQWLLGCSAMINSGRPQGRTARLGYPARDLVSSCHKVTGFMAGLAAELSLAVAEAVAGSQSHLFPK